MSEQSKVLPPSVDPVRGVCVTVDGKRRASNWQFRPFLLDGAGRGRNPLELSRDLLTASGHPKRSVRQVRYAFACNASGQYVPEDRPALSRLSAVPAFCRDLCGESERRSCAIIDCPMWAYRFGDPHSGNRCKAMPVGKRFNAQKATPNNSNPSATTAPAGVVMPEKPQGGCSVRLSAPLRRSPCGPGSVLDAIAARLHTGPIPATASLPCDAAQPDAACDLRAACAHLKGSHHGF